MPIDNRLYEAKDLKKILGLTPETIYLWLRTYHIFEPTERAHGVRGKNKYSLLDLVKLMLISRLQTFGINLTCVQGIFVELDKVDNGKSLWERIVIERNRFDRDGALLVITRLGPTIWSFRGRLGTWKRPPDQDFSVSLLSYKEAVSQFKKELKAPLTTLIVNLNMILRIVEAQTKERLGQ